MSESGCVFIVGPRSGYGAGLTVALKQRGYGVVTAQTGHEAIVKASRDAPACIVSNDPLPDMSSAVFLHFLRWHEVSAPVVFLADEPNAHLPDDKCSALHACVVHKPYRLSVILAAISQADSENTSDS